MIELPEAIRFASQFDEHVRGKRIARAERENSPHKWVFYNRPREDYERLLTGRRIGPSHAMGAEFCVGLDKGLCLQLGGGGERILLHAPGEKRPKKHHLLLEFEDASAITLAVQGWGSCRLLDKGQLAGRQARCGADPSADSFTLDRFEAILADYAEATDRPVKAFFTNESPLAGIGNGYLQDILFAAGVHPRMKVRQIPAAERRKLYRALRKVLAEAIRKGGRDDEIDLLGRGGGYVKALDRRTVGTPCPTCGTTIEKFSFLGGTCYVCPTCQPAPQA